MDEFPIEDVNDSIDDLLKHINHCNDVIKLASSERRASIEKLKRLGVDYEAL